jgi:hypothetical protein
MLLNSKITSRPKMSFLYFVKQTSMVSVPLSTGILILSDASRYLVSKDEARLRDPFAAPPPPKSIHQKIHLTGLYATSLVVRAVAIMVPVVTMASLASKIAVHAATRRVLRDPVMTQRFLTTPYRMPLYVRLVPTLFVSMVIAERIVKHVTYPMVDDVNKRIWQQYLLPKE